MAKELAKKDHEALAVQVKQAVANLANRGGPGFRFSNRTAIDTVVRAIEIECDPTISKQDKTASALFAASVAKNSLTAGEEVQQKIDQLFAGVEQRIIDG